MGSRGSEGAWQRLLDELAAHDGTGVISMEFLRPTPPEYIEKRRAAKSKSAGARSKALNGALSTRV